MSRKLDIGCCIFLFNIILINFLFPIPPSVFKGKGNLNLNDWFCRGYEFIVFICGDDTWYASTTWDKNGGDFSLRYFQMMLDYDDRDFGDIEIIIHNHVRNRNFSLADVRTAIGYYKLGFHGLYMIWIERTQEFRILSNRH